MPVSLRTLAVALACAAALPAAPAGAADVMFRDASAGAACHAANGALANKFTYNLNYLTNVGTADAYVICELVSVDEAITPKELIKLTVDVLLPNAGSTATCMAQVGAFYDGVNFIYASQAQSQTSIGPNAAIQLEWNTTPLQRQQVWQTLTINCKLPAGAKLGLIQRWETLPVET